MKTKKHEKSEAMKTIEGVVKGNVPIRCISGDVMLDAALLQECLGEMFKIMQETTKIPKKTVEKIEKMIEEVHNRRMISHKILLSNRP